MYGAFAKLLNMSLTAGILVLAIILIRGLMKKAPRRYVCILWAVVAVRLVCPVSVESSFSVFNLLPDGNHAEGAAEVFRYSGENGQPEIRIDVPTLAGEDRTAEVHTADFYLPAMIAVWMTGSACMLLYALISYLKLRRATAESILLKDNIYVSEEIDSPFILGVIRPRIFLPSGLAEETRKYVIAHELAHIRRLDHWWKPAGFLLLSVYWFNPILWLAYVLFSRDIEAACDESVVSGLSREGRAGYAEALLNCAVHRRMVTACPLAFGENDVKGRVKNALCYRKPAFWVLSAATIVCCAVGVSFLTDPKDRETEAAEEAQAEDISALNALKEAEEEALRAEEVRQIARKQAEMEAVRAAEEEARKAAEKELARKSMDAALMAGDYAAFNEIRLQSEGWEVQSITGYSRNEDGTFTTEDGKTYTHEISGGGRISESGDDYTAVLLSNTGEYTYEEFEEMIFGSDSDSVSDEEKYAVVALGTRPHMGGSVLTSEGNGTYTVEPYFVPEA